MAIKGMLVSSFFLVVTLSPVLAQARGIDVCYSAVHREGNSVVVENEPLSISAPLDCSQLGMKTLQDLNAAGWDVVNVSYVGNHDHQNRTWLVVVEKK